MPLSAVLLNDTSSENHHGCTRVIRLLSKHAEAVGIRIAARSGVRHRWWNDAKLLREITTADLVIINGEGTLHHGRRYGEDLLRIVDHPASKSTSVVLINALYQENPPHWARYLDRLALIATRDSMSAAEIGRDTGRQDVRWTFDMSLSDTATNHSDMMDRRCFAIGDSVSPSVTRRLRDIPLDLPQKRFVPITTTVKAPKPEYPRLLRLMRNVDIQLQTILFSRLNRDAVISIREVDYVSQIQKSYFHVTGRFHAACISILTRTPFLCVESNSRKIQTLMKDIGLKKDRVVEISQLPQALRDINAWKFDETEARNMNVALARCQRETKAIFIELQKIAQGVATRRAIG